MKKPKSENPSITVRVPPPVYAALKSMESAYNATATQLVNLAVAEFGAKYGWGAAPLTIQPSLMDGPGGADPEAARIDALAKAALARATTAPAETAPSVVAAPRTGRKRKSA